MKDFHKIADEAKWGLIEEPDLIKLLEVVSEINPKVILEIGVRQGFSFRAFIEAFKPDIAIGIDISKKEDLPGHELIPIIPSAHYLWGMDSGKELTRLTVQEILGNRAIDFLFIDGDHSLAGVMKDYSQYSPLVRRNGGIIAFHDILTLKRDTEFVEVQLLFNELKKKYKSLVINETPKDQEKLAFSSGIGLIYM